MRGLGPKGPLFVTKWVKNGVLTGELGPKGPLSGVPHPPKIESGYGPDSNYNRVSQKCACVVNRVALVIQRVYRKGFKCTKIFYSSNTSNTCLHISHILNYGNNILLMKQSWRYDLKLVEN